VKQTIQPTGTGYFPKPALFLFLSLVLLASPWAKPMAAAPKAKTPNERPPAHSVMAAKFRNLYNADFGALFWDPEQWHEEGTH